jgi:hypothetical protein
VLDGRWVNRDSIEEYGGVNLYGYINNLPSYNTDKLGRDRNAPSSVSMDCCGNPPVVFNSATHCCIDGKIVSKEKKKTGIKRCCGYETLNRHGLPSYTPFHCWVETGDGIARGNYPKKNEKNENVPGGQIDNDSIYLPLPEIPPVPGVDMGADQYTWKECVELEASECDYDLNGIKTCLKTIGTARYGYNEPWYDCRHWSIMAYNSCISNNARNGVRGSDLISRVKARNPACDCKLF